MEPKIICEIRGVQSGAVTNLQAIPVKASFKSESRSTQTTQPVIEDRIATFKRELAQEIVDYENEGKTGAGPGILENLPVKFTILTDPPEILFDGIINFKKRYEPILTKNGEAVQVTAAIEDRNGLNQLDVLTRNAFFNVLEAKGVYTPVDYVNIPYIVEKLDAAGELATLSLALFTLTFAIIDRAEKVQKAIADLAAHITGGITGTLAGVIYLVAIALINLITFALLIAEAVRLISEIIRILNPRVRFHKGIFLQDLLEKAFEHFGFKFETDIEELKNIGHLSGNEFGDKEIISGVPRLGQVGETLAQYVGAVLKHFNCRFANIDGTIHLKWEGNPFWKKNSGFSIDDFGSAGVEDVNLDIEKFNYNTDDFETNLQIGFTNDPSDEHIAANWRGMNFLRITEPITVIDEKNLNYDGKRDVRTAFSLAVRKDSISDVSKALAKVAKIADTLINALGGNSNLAGFINGRIGAMKVSQNVFGNSKWVWLEKQTAGNYLIPADHRDKLSARAAYKYHATQSIVNSLPVLQQSQVLSNTIEYIDTAPPNFAFQKRVFAGLEPAFNWDDFKKLLKNSNFTFNGEDAEAESAVFVKENNRATIDFEIQKVWITNVKELFIEPTGGN